MQIIDRGCEEQGEGLRSKPKVQVPPWPEPAEAAETICGLQQVAGSTEDGELETQQSWEEQSLGLGLRATVSWGCTENSTGSQAEPSWAQLSSKAQQSPELRALSEGHTAQLLPEVGGAASQPWAARGSETAQAHTSEQKYGQRASEIKHLHRGLK